MYVSPQLPPPPRRLSPILPRFKRCKLDPTVRLRPPPPLGSLRGLAQAMVGGQAGNLGPRLHVTPFCRSCKKVDQKTQKTPGGQGRSQEVSNKAVAPDVARAGLCASGVGAEAGGAEPEGRGSAVRALPPRCPAPAQWLLGVLQQRCRPPPALRRCGPLQYQLQFESTPRGRPQPSGFSQSGVSNPPRGGVLGRFPYGKRPYFAAPGQSSSPTPDGGHLPLAHCATPGTNALWRRGPT